MVDRTEPLRTADFSTVLFFSIYSKFSGEKNLEKKFKFFLEQQQNFQRKIGEQEKNLRKKSKKKIEEQNFVQEKTV